MKRISLTVAAIVGLCIVSLAVAQARSNISTAYDLTWNTVHSGGASGKSLYTLIGTSGQPAVGSMSSGSFMLDSGFWPGTLADYRIFLPLVMKND